MTATHKKYFVSLGIASLLMFVLYFVFMQQLPAVAISIVPVFLTINVVSHFLLLRSVSGNGRSFFTYFVAAMGFKMMAYFIYLTIVHVMTGGITLPFVFAFFIVYIVFTGIEMFFLGRKTKQN